MTTATRGVAEEQLAVEMENALNIPEKFYLKISLPLLSPRVSGCIVSVLCHSSKERVVARGTACNN